ncbi:unnamed protein product [Urochloa humidicola]
MADGEGKETPCPCLAGQTALVGRLLKRISEVATDEDSNLVFSPLSIHVALALMSVAARGATLAEIVGFAGAPSRDELAAFVRAAVLDRVLADRSDIGGPSIAFACGAWTDRSLPADPKFVDAIVNTYKGGTWTVDFRNKPFESRRQINAWVAQKTKNLITQVLDPNDPNRDTVRVIANAIYFKAEWRNPFKEEHTDDSEFRRLDGSTVEVPFLQSWCPQYIACHKGFKVLKLPYEAMDAAAWKTHDWEFYESLPKFSMCVFLPAGRKGLQSVVEKIASSPRFLHDHIPTKSVPVGDFRLPKFKLAFERNIVDDLMHLGLKLPFTGDDICVNRVIHKAVIEMNEEGSEAAAVTVESDDDMGCSLFDSYEPEPKRVNFVADHPFAFFILEETSGTIVFAGHVLDPSKEV